MTHLAPRGSATIGLLLAIIFSCSAAARAQITSTPELKEIGDLKMSIKQPGRVRAPELTGIHGAAGWLNTDRPLTLAALRGKFVLLDFWTYGCVNCIHIIPDLKKLEAKYARELVVIGVHSAKFDNEKETEQIRRVVLRYEIEHPVVNDADFRIWNNYAVNAWPTQVLIAPDGYVVGKVVGEGNHERLDETIAELIPEYRERGQLDASPVALALERAKQAPMPLQFPGKVLADEKGKRLFIADSNHNRIVVATLDGVITDTIGNGVAGRADGNFDAATFFRPQGLALDVDGTTLYVADTENRLLRAVDLKKRLVRTIAGTGEQLRERFTEGAARETRLSSPWDLIFARDDSGDKLYIAMAGTHQIWRMDLSTARLALFAGSERWREARADGARLDAAFAQPSGLASDGKSLYVADSESNIIRAVDLAGEDGEVRTLVGGDLFQFGDEDGTGDDARLQHPLGVVVTNGAVYVADTYNHKIKRLDPATQTITSFAGTGKPGQQDGARASFYEPGGISAANNFLYIADTNNHAIRRIDLRTKQTTTLALKGLRPPSAMSAPDTDAASATQIARASEIVLQTQMLRADDAGTLNLDVRLPAGYHLNDLAPHRVDAGIAGGSAGITFAGGQTVFKRSAKDLTLPVQIPLATKQAGAGELRVALTLYYCREDNTGACRIATVRWRVPVEVKPNAPARGEIVAKGEIKL